MNSNTDLFSAQCLSLHNTKEFFVKHLIYEPGSGAGLFKLFNLPNQIETKKRAKPEIIYHLGYHNKIFKKIPKILYQVWQTRHSQFCKVWLEFWNPVNWYLRKVQLPSCHIKAILQRFVLTCFCKKVAYIWEL